MTENAYPFDPDTLAEVRQRLYAAVPAMHRLPDEPPAGRGELQRMLEVLAVPLAVLRQSVQELQGDLFVDTADDAMLPYLARMIGTELVFPDADSNRRDVRGTVGWRRRKGTPSALEEMGAELTAQSVTLIEGWKRVQLTQDLNLLRPERVLTQLRPAVVAEQTNGPLDSVSHLVDVRSSTARTGRYHPLDVAHYVQPTITFPLSGGTATALGVPGSDVRFSMDPAGAHRPLRARRPTGDRRPFLDRIPERHFAADPGRWFGADGGFTVRVLGLPAGLPPQPLPASGRTPAIQPVDRSIARGAVTLSPLDLPHRGWRGVIRIELGLAAVAGAGTGSWRPTPASFVPRAWIELDAGQVIGSGTGGAPPSGTRVPLLRIRTPGATGRFLPGLTLEAASDAPGARAAAASAALASEGFLRGALPVTIPPMQVIGDRYLHIAADGSVYDGGSGPVLRTMPETNGQRVLDPGALLVLGPGPAWPPQPVSSEPDYVTSVPSAPGRGPAVAHGCVPVRIQPDGSFGPLLAGTDCALTLAMQIDRPGGAGFRPFQRLTWHGTAVSSGHWSVLDQDGAPVPSGAAAAELEQIVQERERNAGSIALALRFECNRAGVSLCPGEVAWTGDDGRTVLIHLPQLAAVALAPGSWPSGGPFAAASEPVRVGLDGSTWDSDSTAGRRVSLGAVTPVGSSATLRRRIVRGRRLCAWANEDWAASPPEVLPLTLPGGLDVDVLHGLFAFAAEEAPQEWPPGPGSAAPPSVTYDCAEAATMHVGALPAAREPALGRQLPLPSRLVTRDGTFDPGAPVAWRGLPRHDSLAAALADISRAWQALTPADVARAGGDFTEVIQFEDSATYPEQALVWPSAPASPAAAAAARFTLIVQAAERQRPVLLIDPAAGWSSPAHPAAYRQLSFTGLMFGAIGWNGMALPAAERVSLTFCTVLDAGNILRVVSQPRGTTVTVDRSQTAGLVLAGPGEIVVADSIVDGPPEAIQTAGTVRLDRCSVGGDVRCRVLEASEVIFDGAIIVLDRFAGCVRFSRVAAAQGLPRSHRLAVGTPIPLVSRTRRDPAWWRLRDAGSPAITRGAENGAELGVFHATQSAARMAGFERRLTEFTPAGLRTGVIRLD